MCILEHVMYRCELHVVQTAAGLDMSRGPFSGLFRVIYIYILHIYLFMYIAYIYIYT